MKRKRDIPFIQVGKHLPSPQPLALAVRVLDWSLQTPGKLSTPCWLWQGHCDEDGYGEVKWRGYKYRAARISYAAFRGAIPDGFDVDHLCTTPACINPHHLTLETPEVNRVPHRYTNIDNIPI